MLSLLWKDRDRPPVGSHAWFKAWAKRLQQMPQLWRHYRAHRRLRQRGAHIDPTAVLVDPQLISGHLSDFVVGSESFVGRVKIAVHAPVHIGARACLNDGVQLLTATHDIRHPHWPTVARPIRIEDYAWIATGAIILPGVTIGRGAVVGAGAVVSRDVPANAVAAGNPAVLKTDQRATDLDYTPTASLALFTAWRSLKSREP